jgi:acyl-CoA thioester hydrolase
VNNAAIAAYFETGRAELMTEAAGPPAARAFGLAVVRVAIDYRREAHYPARLRIGCAVRRIGGSSITLDQAIFQAQDCIASAEAVFVLLDRATRRPRPVPDDLGARFGALAPLLGSVGACIG